MTISVRVHRDYHHSQSSAVPTELSYKLVGSYASDYQVCGKEVAQQGQPHFDPLAAESRRVPSSSLHPRCAHAHTHSLTHTHIHLIVRGISGGARSSAGS